MTDAPLSINAPLSLVGTNLTYNGIGLVTFGRRTAELVAAQLAAAARVPELEATIRSQSAEIERLRAELGIAQSTKAEVKRGAAALLAENGELRARLAAAPDLAELRAAREAMRKRTEFVDTAAFMEAVDRLLAAVPSTGEPCQVVIGEGRYCGQPIGHSGPHNVALYAPPPTGTDGGAA